MRRTQVARRVFIPKPSLPSSGKPKLQTSGVSWKANTDTEWKPFSVPVTRRRHRQQAPRRKSEVDPYENRAIRKMPLQDYLAGGFGLPEDLVLHEERDKIVEMPTPDGMWQAEQEREKERRQRVWENVIPEKLRTRSKEAHPAGDDASERRIAQLSLQEVVVTVPTPTSNTRAEWTTVVLRTQAGVVLRPSDHLVATVPPSSDGDMVDETDVIQMVSYRTGHKPAALEMVETIGTAVKSAAPHVPGNSYLATMKYPTMEGEDGVDARMFKARDERCTVPNIYSPRQVQFGSCATRMAGGWRPDGAVDYSELFKSILEGLQGADFKAARHLCEARHFKNWNKGKIVKSKLSGVGFAVLGDLFATRWDVEEAGEIFKEQGWIAAIERQILASVWNAVAREDGIAQPPDYLPTVGAVTTPPPLQYLDIYRAQLEAHNFKTPYPPPVSFPHAQVPRRRHIPLHTLDWYVADAFVSIVDTMKPVQRAMGVPGLRDRTQTQLGEDPFGARTVAASLELPCGVNIDEVLRAVSIMD
eukprot:TRINITY_DN24732_c0_g1_i1.p1 TRINITY_DN24732_c0_g1~~TRINITY_DN24732_c0_g1_i1.p1  ORF type:complete len:529 (+),score=120.49 TRINITY_DN24732_c0_g1_i1:37-1623(+)